MANKSKKGIEQFSKQITEQLTNPRFYYQTSMFEEQKLTQAMEAREEAHRADREKIIGRVLATEMLTIRF
jgi:hypothetical protein